MDSFFGASPAVRSDTGTDSHGLAKKLGSQSRENFRVNRSAKSFCISTGAPMTKAAAVAVKNPLRELLPQSVATTGVFRKDRVISASTLPGPTSINRSVFWLAFCIAEKNSTGAVN